MRSPAEAIGAIRSLAASGDQRSAAQLAERAMARWPERPEFAVLRALAAERLADWPGVLRGIDRAERLAPDKPLDALAGWALLQEGRVEESIARLRRAVAGEPANAAAWINLGLALERQGELDEAARCQAEAARLGPQKPQPTLNLAGMALERGAVDESLDHLERWLQRSPSDPLAAGMRAMVGLYRADPDAGRERLEAERAGAILAQTSEARPFLQRRARKRGEPLRVGFVSGDLRDHSVASFLLPLIERLDRSLVAPILFATNAARDAVSARFAKTAPLVDAAGLDAEGLAESARGKQLDIAIDLGGHTRSGSLAAFARRLAPLQVSWLGYPGTTGLPAIDARFVDSITDPIGSEASCTERLVRLDPCFLVWRSRAEVPLPPPVARPVTFGSFNDFPKMNASVLATWRRILDAVPGSRLLLKAYSFRSEAGRSAFRERAASVGLDPGRVELRSWSATHAEHLALYPEIDVALDTFPYAGTTTTCEALWMGVPVVTLAGVAHRSRVGASILSAIGQADLVAADLDGYVARAVSLAAGRPDAARLRAACLASPLCDEAGFARRFAEALRGLAEG